MSTRGMFGIKKNGRLRNAAYIGSDAYYTGGGAGIKIAKAYFKGDKQKLHLWAIGKKTSDGPYVSPIDMDEARRYIKDGVWNDYSYLYNEDNNTIEVYRGHFPVGKTGPKMSFRKAMDAGKVDDWLEQTEKAVFTTRRVFIMDKKKDTFKDVATAMLAYDKSDDETNDKYPERRHISVWEAPNKKVIPVAIGVVAIIAFLYFMKKKAVA